MTIEQCYSAIESNYEEVLGRFAGNKMLVEKFARKFLDDPSYQTLVETMDKADYEEAFRAAHTLFVQILDLRSCLKFPVI